MKWKMIRLELARTNDFPDGSVSRAYLLRLPLAEDGLIDERALRDAPAQAIARRCWPNEPEMAGYLVAANGGLSFSDEPAGDCSGNVFHLETRPIRMGERVLLTEPNGRKLPFRVASLERVR